ncbi:DUF732 domain-containing protein [Mycolicibacterium sp. 120270]|uniref:DUF732 domain-containing protein n=1 Tax=Mycolicibacterium sp. 120270 TaxID=3090600 RepID=UPI00299D583B|nr:DUF732 domain-containing protein [Mycolicibacterium sp. 120270]MDX1885167.1 DUF732 domain-containing protein [Mycolicibacterium sp. 120270]
MAEQGKTATALRWVTGVFTLGVLSAAATGLAAPASADSSTFLQTLAPRYTFLSDQQLLSAGKQACAAARSGVPASDNVILVSKQLGISTSAAWEIVLASINHLGC